MTFTDALLAWDSWFWTILRCSFAGAIGYLAVVWTEQRRAGRPPIDKARINTVWDTDGKVVYDHPVRGLSARAMTNIMKDLICSAPTRFLSDFVFKRRRGPALWRPKDEVVEFVFNRPRNDQERLAVDLSSYAKPRKLDLKDRGQH